MRAIRIVELALAAALLTALVLPAAGVGSTASPHLEGKLSIVAWDGLLEKEWVGPFERQVRNDVFQSLTFTRRVLTLVSTASLRRRRFRVSASRYQVPTPQIGVAGAS